MKRLAIVFPVVILAICCGCGGSMSNSPRPVLMSVALSPSMPAVPVSSTLQMKAIGTYSDHSTKDLTAAFPWNVGDLNLATVSASGLVSGITVGNTSLMFGPYGANGYSTVPLSVTIGLVTRIQVYPNSVTIAPGSAGTIQCLANIAGTTELVDVTASTTWSVVGSPGGIAISPGVSPAIVSVALNMPSGMYTINAVYSGAQTFTASATLTVQ